MKYKAYSYWPGIFLESSLKLKDVEFIESESENNEGTILAIENDCVLIGCKKGSLKIKTIQAPSKKAISSVDYLRGQRLEKGDSLK